VQFGKEVRRRRRAARLTLEQLAERAGLSPNYVGSIEKGDRDPSLSSVLALAQGLKVPAGELVGGLPELGPGGLEAGRLFEAAGADVQEAVLALLHALARRRR
jgi:transcriptional regulator with XRE-family HTH domain